MKTLVFRFNSNNALITKFISEKDDLIILEVDSKKATFNKATEKLIVEQEEGPKDVSFTDFKEFDVNGIKGLMDLVTFACRDQRKNQFYLTLNAVSKYILEPFNLKITYDVEDNRSWRFFITTAIKGFNATKIEIRVAREGFSQSLENVPEFKDYKFSHTFLREGNESFSEILFNPLAQTYENIFKYRASELAEKTSITKNLERLGVNVTMFARSPIELLTAIKEGSVTIDQAIEWHKKLNGEAK